MTTLDWCLICRMDGFLRVGDHLVEAVPLCRACGILYGGLPDPKTKECSAVDTERLEKARQWAHDHSQHLTSQGNERIARYVDVDVNDARPPAIKRLCACQCGGDLGDVIGNVLPGHEAKVIKPEPLPAPVPKQFRPPVVTTPAVLRVSNPLAELSALPDDIPEMPKELREGSRKNRKQKGAVMAKLDERQITRALKLHGEGKTASEIAEDLEIPVWAVYQSAEFKRRKAENDDASAAPTRRKKTAALVHQPRTERAETEPAGILTPFLALRNHLEEQKSKLQKAIDALNLAMEAMR